MCRSRSNLAQISCHHFSKVTFIVIPQVISDFWEYPSKVYLVQICCHHFSKISFVVILHSQFRSNLNFANFCLAIPRSFRDSPKKTATPCNTLQQSATPCNTLQQICTWQGQRLFREIPNTLQHPATWINTLQHTTSDLHLASSQVVCDIFRTL